MASTDALLDAYGRLLRALMVLHHEADSDLDFDAYVELANVRYDGHVRTMQEPELPENICPQEGCVQGYAPDTEPYVLGTDHNGVSVYARTWRCAAGHWFTVEMKT